MINLPSEISRLVFFGTPEESVPFLKALDSAGFDVVLAVTRPDKRRGRRADPTPSPVKSAAQNLAIAVSSQVDDALESDADLGVVVAFGQIIKPHVLNRLPMVNVHFSLLPRWRGAAPVERAILAGDPTTGVCLMQVAEQLDAGAVYRRVELPIGPDVTAEHLKAQLVESAVPMLVAALQEGLGTPEPQEGTPVYAAKITRDELRLQWNQPAAMLHRQVRVGGAWTTWRGKTLKVWSAVPVDGLQPPGELAGHVVGTGEGLLRLVEVQAEGKARQPADDWLRGSRPAPGERLG